VTGRGFLPPPPADTRVQRQAGQRSFKRSAAWCPRTCPRPSQTGMPLRESHQRDHDASTNHPTRILYSLLCSGQWCAPPYFGRAIPAGVRSDSCSPEPRNAWPNRPPPANSCHAWAAYPQTVSLSATSASARDIPGCAMGPCQEPPTLPTRARHPSMGGVTPTFLVRLGGSSRPAFISRVSASSLLGWTASALALSPPLAMRQGA